VLHSVTKPCFCLQPMNSLFKGHTMSLCSSCQLFDIQFLSQVDYPWKNIPSKAVLSGDMEGCPFCGLLISSLGEDSRTKMANKSLWVRIYFDRLEQMASRSENVEQHNALRVRWLRVSLCSTLGQLDRVERSCEVVLHVAADDGMWIDVPSVGFPPSWPYSRL
jgi:hypothetical protein